MVCGVPMVNRDHQLLPAFEVQGEVAEALRSPGTPTTAAGNTVSHSRHIHGSTGVLHTHSTAAGIQTGIL